MAWKKAPPELVELLEEILPKDPRAERRKMFGYPCSFVNGNLWIGLHEHNLLLRLDEKSRAELLELPDARVFEPLPGRVMREYVVVPEALLEEPRELRGWVKRAFTYALSLERKVPKPRKQAATKVAKKTTKKAATKLVRKAATKVAKKTTKKPRTKR